MTLSADPLSPADIESAARKLNVVFPPDYVSFMLRHNGGRPHPRGFPIQWEATQVCGEDWRASSVSVIHHIWSERDNSLERSNLVSFEGRIPKDTLTIGDDAFGNQILLAVGGRHAGKILFWAMEHEVEEGEEPSYDNVGVIADSFDDFINNKLY